MKPSLLASGSEKAPANPNLNYIPPGSAPFKVTASDNWWKLAARPEVKAAGLSAMDLCAFNFQTRNAMEINWYLRNKIGCNKTTSDRQNYLFSDDATPGIVYLPRGGGGGVIELDETIVVGNGPGSPDSGGTREYSIEKETPRPLAAGTYVLFKVKITGKVAIQWGNASADFKSKIAFNASKNELTLGGSKKLADDITLQIGGKIKAIDILSPAAWRKTLKEGLEATVKKKLKTPLIGAVETGMKLPKDGLFFLVKFTTQEATLPIGDLCWMFDTPEENVTTMAKVSFQIAFSVGPSPLAIRAMAPVLASPEVAGFGALAGLAAWVAFCGYGISSTYQKSDDMAFYTWYVTGYVDEVLPAGGGFQLPPNAQDRVKAQEMIRLGKADAKATAAKEFAGFGMDPVQAYHVTLLAMFDSDGFTALSQARVMLRKLVCAKLLQEKGIKTF